jgi:probable HAF family extracellular repeat protein
MKSPRRHPWTFALAGTIRDCRNMVATVLGIVFAAIAPASAQFTWTDLGHLGDGESNFSALSANGLVVTGTGYNDSGELCVFRWTSGTGIVNLGTLGGEMARALGLNSDGTTIIGTRTTAAGEQRAFRWREAGVHVEPGTVGGDASEPQATSADGSVVVGWAFNNLGNSRAFRWSPGSSPVNLGTLGGIRSLAAGVSADGTVVVGDSLNSAGNQRAFRWTQGSGMVDLGTLGGTRSWASMVSADGSVVVGQAFNSSAQSRAFRWTQGSGMVDLGTLGGTQPIPYGLSADGSTVVGSCFNADFQRRAFRWRQGSGMVALGTLGGGYSQAQAVSANGNVVVGFASNAAEDSRLFVWTSRAGMVDVLQMAAARGVDVVDWVADENGSGISADGDTLAFQGIVNGSYRAVRVSGLNLDETQPPVSSVSTAPSPTGGWINALANVTVTATDAVDGSGVKEIRTAVDMGPEQVTFGNTATIPVNGDGIHTIAYRAVDFAGNVETVQYVTVKIDTTAPTVGAWVVGGKLEISASDALSGITSIAYKIDNGAVQSYTGPVTVPAGARKIDVRAVDVAGNSSAWKSVATVAFLKQVIATPASVMAGGSTVIRVDLNAAAPAGGLIVDVAASDPAALQIASPTVTIPAGASSATVNATAAASQSARPVEVSATFADLRVSTSVTITPRTPKSIKLVPSVVTSGMTSTATLTMSAAAGSAVEVSLQSLDESVATVPANVTVNAGSATAKFTVTAKSVTSEKSVLVRATVDGVSAVAVLWVRPVLPTAVSATPTSVASGANVALKVTLSRPAPAGYSVSFSSSDSSVLDPGTSLAIPAGATTATLNVNAGLVAADRTAIVRVSYGIAQVRTSVRVTSAKLANVSISPTSVAGGASATATVTLVGKAPEGGLEVVLRSSAAAATVPISVVVPAGASTANFPVITATVPATTAVTLSARAGGIVKTAVLTVNK